MQALAPSLLEVAREAKAEYTAALRRGEEPHYPFWSDAVIKQHEQAEQLTARLEALGRKE